MKHSWLLLPLIGVWSCDTAIGPPPTPEPSVLTALNCPTRPETDLSGSTELVFTPGESLKKDVRVTAQKPLGYVFDAQTGYTLEYTVDPSDIICIWVFSPDTEILSEDQYSNLPLSGTYTLQISSLSGSENVNLELSLKDPRIVLDLPIEPDEPNEPDRSDKSDASDASNASTSTSTGPSSLTEDQALQIVQDWLEAKKIIFASPYDTGRLDELTTGQKNEDSLGAIRWLKENNCYWRYPLGKVELAGGFSASQKKAVVSITETLKRYCNSKLQEEKGPNTNQYEVFFEFEDGNWKISDIS